MTPQPDQSRPVEESLEAWAMRAGLHLRTSLTDGRYTLGLYASASAPHALIERSSDRTREAAAIYLRNALMYLGTGPGRPASDETSAREGTDGTL